MKIITVTENKKAYIQENQPCNDSFAKQQSRWSVHRLIIAFVFSFRFSLRFPIFFNVWIYLDLYCSLCILRWFTVLRIYLQSGVAMLLYCRFSNSLNIEHLCANVTSSFLASGNYCRLLITIANSLNRDQDRQNVGPDLDPNVWHTVFLKEFFEKKTTKQFLK